jgi:prepilin-type N-terminal cleavage/methylation domain-containing protein
MRSRTSTYEGFTLIEVLVVIVIILIVSALALPTVISGMSHRQVGESARILQALLAGARDSAIRTNAPSGIRLLPCSSPTRATAAAITRSPVLALML